MSNLSTWFGWRGGETTNEELPNIFPLSVLQSDFIETDVVNIYAKILTDAMERTAGMPDEKAQLLWDNCLKSSKADGLITMLAKAMSAKKELFLVYEESVQVIREATSDEKRQIETDYAKSAASKTGIYVSFQQYTRTDMVKLYSGLEYCTISALSKSMNLSKAIQFKMSDMRASVGAMDGPPVRTQVAAMAKALGDGKDIMMDAKDIIETAKPDLTSVQESMNFLDAKRSFYLGLPSSYITGEQTKTIGSATGEGDTKAIERGLKSYFFSILKPVIEELLGVKLTYKTQDFRQISQALEAIKTFEITSEEYLGLEAKKKIIEGLLDIDASQNQTEAPAAPAPVPQLPPGKGAPPPAKAPVSNA